METRKGRGRGQGSGARSMCETSIGEASIRRLSRRLRVVVVVSQLGNRRRPRGREGRAQPRRGVERGEGGGGVANREGERAEARAGRGCPRRRGVDVRAFARARAHLRGPILSAGRTRGDAPPAPAEDATAGINLGSSPQLNSKPMPATEGIVRVERSPVTSGAAREGFCANSPRSLSSVSTPGRVSEKRSSSTTSRSDC